MRETEREFATLYREHFAFVWRILRQLGVPAPLLEDAAQEVFVVVHRRRESWTHGSAKSWLFGIARRVAADTRRAQRRVDRKLRAVAVAGSGRPHPAGRFEAADFVAHVLAALDPGTRMVFVLADVEGMTAVEIGAAMGLNINTVYSRLRSARARFRAANEGLAPSPGTDSATGTATG